MPFLGKRLARMIGFSTLTAGLTGGQMLATAAEGELESRLAARNDSSTLAKLTDRRLADPLSTHSNVRNIIDPQLHAASGRQEVIVRLREAPVATSEDQSSSGRKAWKKQVRRNQDAFLERARGLAPGNRVTGRTQVVINAITMEVDGSQIETLAQDPAVYSINRVKEYRMHLSETVPYIGATTVQNLGYTGAGVSVGVIDSGIDYLHANLGGSGDPNEYASNDPTLIEPGTFPTPKVVGGYDFVGSEWGGSGDPLMPDPDPLDDGPEAGHGTHVADIIGGFMGVAPDADLYALKACSSVSTSCSGVGLIQAIEWAADPNGDGDPSDRLMILNMSLGSDYGQPFDDDLAAAVDNISHLGTLVVASAGNGGNKPFITGTPSSAASALSVAQTQVPSAVQPILEVNGQEYPAVFQPWSVAPTGVISGPLQYGDGAGGNLDGCAPFTTDLSGLVVLVDRGGCNFTLKIKNVGDAGGVIGIIGLVAPGDPFSGGDGGDRPINIPGYMVSQSVSNTFKSLEGEILTVDPANGIPLVGQMVGSSSRGPQHEDTHLVKPEIGAPGASVSAIAGTGVDTGPFGGTSGAAPMVSGSAALLLQMDPTMHPAVTKARLVNSGETDIDTDPLTGLAPITRIGGGEVRVDNAVYAPAIATERHTGQAALSFGYHDVDRSSHPPLHKTVVLQNLTGDTLHYSVSPTFRYAEDEASGAVEVSVSPSRIRLRPWGEAHVRVTMRLRGSLLPDNAMNSGSEGANPDTLTTMEYDGYLNFEDGLHSIHMPWQVLPRKAAKVSGRGHLNTWRGSDSVRLRNLGEGTAQNDPYALIALSGNLPEGDRGEQSPTPDIRAVGVNTVPVEAGFCSASPSFVWSFAITTWERQQHLLPVSHIVYLDTDRDGTDDFAILNRDLSGLNTISDGRQVAWALDLSTGDATAFFFAEHATNTANTVLTICAEQVGLGYADLLATQVDVDVQAQDFYYGGPGDLVEGLTVTPYGERFVGTVDDIPPGGRGELEVEDYGLFPGNTPEHGILLYTNGDRGAGARGAATADTEALLFLGR